MSSERRPWNPDKAWADPLIGILALLCLLASSMALATRRQAAAQPPRAVSLQGRLMDLALGAQIALGLPSGRAPEPRDLTNPWDRALAAVLAAESKALEPAKRLVQAEPQDPAFKAAFEAAYLQGTSGTLPPAVREGLGSGLASRLLEARLAPEGTRASARKAAIESYHARIATLLVLGGLVCLLALGGLAYGILLAANWPRPAPVGPRFPLPGRAVVLVFLGWFSGFFLTSLLASSLGSALPALRPWTLPLAYASQAAWGLWLILQATGQSFRELRSLLFPGRWGTSFAHALGGWGLALAAIALLGLLLSPFLRGKASPQEELVEGLRAAHGLQSVVLFLTVAVLAPCFEELMMRGFLLGHLRTRWSPFPALAATSLLFGFIHLQPLALPTLSTLGALLGLILLRTGDLRSSILIHGAWNGSIFLLVRALT
ncbi:MAG TPA: type II CAAX endopeptidase family protein [Holophagaceae bacterium]|nr:type II CAAX endopeptidase family protein [Holophagaceae bacterium]HJW32577.1 type II CAAX endopeptidase family protein [Holophagaceae bacterium]